MKVFYFNLSHDVQLASGMSLYNLSKNVRSLEYALQPLAVFAAQRGDSVAVHPDMVRVCNEFYHEEISHNGISFIPSDQIPSDVEIEPWGWDVGLRKVLRNDSLLCSSERLLAIRNLSSREMVEGCLKNIRNMLPDSPLCGESFFCKSMEQIVDALCFIGGKAVLKAPWSSSGRGLRFTDADWGEDTQRWCRNQLLNQGGVEVEPFYQKICDWAMEFYADADGNVDFTGLSHFFTSPLAAYCGGRVAPQKVLLEEWQQWGSLILLQEVKNALQQTLRSMVKGVYQGHLGVDMMFCETPDKRVVLHPCVEINFRRTMGQMAMWLGENPRFSNIKGHFEIHYASSPMLLQNYLKTIEKQVIMLTPVTAATLFAAYVLVD